jgi:FKBP-type peptidyl-prolyl cis-trans isomerase FkpA
MKQLFNAAVICIVALSACTTPFKKAKDGSEYKVISNKSGKLAVKGDIFEMNASARYKDSVLFNSLEDGMPQYGMYDTASFPSPYKEAFKVLHAGDSVIIRMSTDSIIARGQGQTPPFIKKGQFIYQTYTIANLYKTKEQADSAQKLHMEIAQKRDSILATVQIVKDSKIIDEYIAKNKVTAVKSEKGTYVEIMDAGTGNVADSTQVLLINYTGKSFEGVAFDSNTDSSFQHVEPLPVNMSAPQVIPGWVDGLKMLKKGAKAKFYVPSSLAYGKRGNGDKIKPNENLVFDINVVDIISQAKFAEMMKKRQEQQMAQQKMMEQMQKMMQKQNPDQQQQTAPPANK